MYKFAYMITYKFAWPSESATNEQNHEPNKSHNSTTRSNCTPTTHTKSATCNNWNGIQGFDALPFLVGLLWIQQPKGHLWTPFCHWRRSLFWLWLFEIVEANYTNFPGGNGRHGRGHWLSNGWTSRCSICTSSVGRWIGKSQLLACTSMANRPSGQLLLWFFNLRNLQRFYIWGTVVFKLV